MCDGRDFSFFRKIFPIFNLLNRTKQIFTFFFLALFGIIVFNYLFFIVFITSQKNDFRKELITSSAHTEKVEISKVQLHKSGKGIEWHENNSEIVLNGSYYELLGTEESGDKVILHIIKDDKESKLFDSYFSSREKNNRMLFNIIKLFFGLNVSSVADQAPPNTVCILKSGFPHYNSVWFDPNYYSKTIKPPESRF